MRRRRVQVRDPADQRAPVWQRRHSRIERAVWAVLIGLPLAGWLALGAAGLAYRPQPVDTGDALLDAFLKAALAHDVVVGLWAEHPPDYYYYSDYAPEFSKVFDSWEQKYIADPRAWQLMLHYCGYAEERGVGPNPSGLSTNFTRDELLQLAHQRGIEDPYLLMRLLVSLDVDARVELLIAKTVTRPNSRTATTAEWERYYRQLRAETDKLAGSEPRQLERELFASAGQYSWPYYYAAALAWERDDSAKALKLLEQGNAAPLNDTLAAFPYPELVALQRSGKQLDPVLIGWLVDWRSNLDLPNSASLGTFNVALRSMAEHAAQAGDLRALQIMHTAACRRGLARLAGPNNARLAATLVESIADKTRTALSGRLSTADAAALSQLRSQAGRLVGSVRSLSRPSRYSATLTPVPMQPSERLLWLCTNRRSQVIAELRQSYTSFVTTQQALDGSIRLELEQLARFDYTALALK